MRQPEIRVSNNPPAQRTSIRWSLGIAALFAACLISACTPRESRSLVVYTSQDKVYAEQILQDFERESGIKTRVVYDSEAVKTVGLANRLLAERNHPQCDLFWNNEELRTRQLEREMVFGATPEIKTFGFRSRQIVFNSSRLQPVEVPKSLLELTNAAWKGKIALAYPLFGTTATHFLALRQHWGEHQWETWCRGLMANQPLVVDGNSVVVKLVGSGEAWIGLTDSDDVAAGRREGMPVAGIIPRETFYIQNSMAAVRQPASEESAALMKYLVRDDVLQKLVKLGAIEGTEVPKGGVAPKDWNLLLQDLEPATATLKAIFLRQRAER